LLRYFVGFYRESLFNDHWGEHAHIGEDNVLDLLMVCHDSSTEEVRKTWQPFLDWVASRPGAYTIEGQPILGSIPARHWWDVEWRKQNHQAVFDSDQRPGASSNNVWWAGDAGQVAWFIYGYESLWMPASLLDDDSQERLAQALFRGSRYKVIELHFNKGLAGGPRQAIEATRDTATNPAVLNAFALAIVGDAGGGYPGVRGHEPDVAAGRKSRDEIHKCVSELRAIVPKWRSLCFREQFFPRGLAARVLGKQLPASGSREKEIRSDGIVFRT